MSRVNQYLELVEDNERHIRQAGLKLESSGFRTAKEAYVFCMDVYSLLAQGFRERNSSKNHTEDINLEHLMAFLDASLNVIDEIEEGTKYSAAIERDLLDPQKSFLDLRIRLIESDRLEEQIRMQGNWKRKEIKPEEPVVVKDSRNGVLAREYFDHDVLFETVISGGKYDGEKVTISRFKRRVDHIERLPPGSLPAVLRRIGETNEGYSISALGNVEENSGLFPFVVIGDKPRRYHGILEDQHNS